MTPINTIIPVGMTFIILCGSTLCLYSINNRPKLVIKLRIVFVKLSHTGQSVTSTINVYEEEEKKKKTNPHETVT